MNHNPSTHETHRTVCRGALLIALVAAGCSPAHDRGGLSSAMAPAVGHPPASQESPRQFAVGGHVFGFAHGSYYVSNGSYLLRVGFVGAHTVAPFTADGPIEGKPWSAPLGKVSYPDLYDGITLTYDAVDGGLVRSTWAVEPHADVGAIRLHYNRPVVLEAAGTLSVAFELGTMIETAPAAWQELMGRRVPVTVQFRHLGESEVGFALGAYDASRTLFIDPTLMWNSFLGGSRDDVALGVDVDGSGNVFVTGWSDATWGSPVRAFSASEDAFVAKLDASGNLIWSTFLGGPSPTTGQDIKLDDTGHIYVAGWSEASWGSPVQAYAADMDTFVAKLDAGGNLIWNTFLGGVGGDYGANIDVSGNDGVYVGGRSDASWGSPVRAYTASEDAFAAKLNASGHLTWLTFLGGSGTDYGALVEADHSGNVYVAGSGDVGWGSPVRGFSADYDAFVAKLDVGGNLIWNTFMGGAGVEQSYDIALDGLGNTILSGRCNASWGSPKRAYTVGDDAFVLKLDPTGSLTWLTFLGGVGLDSSHGVIVNGSGNVYVAGTSNATWDSPTQAYAAGDDAFAAELDASGSLVWNTFLGGAGDEYGIDIGVDRTGSVFLVGRSTGTWGRPVRGYTGAADAFVAKLGNPAPPSAALCTPKLCPRVADRVLPAIVAEAMDRPETVQGYCQLQNPNISWHALFNPRRMSLTLQNVGRPYHPHYNRLVYKSGCN